MPLGGLTKHSWAHFGVRPNRARNDLRGADAAAAFAAAPARSPLVRKRCARPSRAAAAAVLWFYNAEPFWGMCEAAHTVFRPSHAAPSIAEHSADNAEHSADNARRETCSLTLTEPLDR